jgi:hypothetical protein
VTATVYKYRLAVDDGPMPLALPIGAEVLHAEMALRDGSPLTDHTIEMWAQVDPTAGPEQRWFSVRGTGHPVPSVARHVASMRDGIFVWHLFEVPAAVAVQ